MPLPISTVFADLPDPRSEINRRHLSTDILTTALCGVISRADGWEDIVESGRSKKDFFTRFLELPNGFPAATRSTGCSPASTWLRSPSGSGGGWRRRARRPG